MKCENIDRYYEDRNRLLSTSNTKGIKGQVGFLKVFVTLVWTIRILDLFCYSPFPQMSSKNPSPPIAESELNSIQAIWCRVLISVGKVLPLSVISRVSSNPESFPKPTFK